MSLYFVLNIWKLCNILLFILDVGYLYALSPSLSLPLSPASLSLSLSVSLSLCWLILTRGLPMSPIFLETTPGGYLTLLYLFCNSLIAAIFIAFCLLTFFGFLLLFSLQLLAMDADLIHFQPPFSVYVCKAAHFSLMTSSVMSHV